MGRRTSESCGPGIAESPLKPHPVANIPRSTFSTFTVRLNVHSIMITITIYAGAFSSFMSPLGEG